MVINPYFLSAQQTSAQAPAQDSVMLDLDAIYRLADEESRVIRVSEASLRAASENVK